MALPARASVELADRVGAFDLGPEFLLHPFAFDFQSRREQPVIDRPGFESRHHASHPDVARESFQALVGALDEALLVGLPSHRDKREERPAFTDQDALFEYAIAED